MMNDENNRKRRAEYEEWNARKETSWKLKVAGKISELEMRIAESENNYEWRITNDGRRSNDEFRIANCGKKNNYKWRIAESG